MSGIRLRTAPLSAYAHAPVPPTHTRLLTARACATRGHHCSILAVRRRGRRGQQPGDEQAGSCGARAEGYGPSAPLRRPHQAGPPPPTLLRPHYALSGTVPGLLCYGVGCDCL
eukprot:1159396-Rhodomonas_salina.2